MALGAARPAAPALGDPWVPEIPDGPDPLGEIDVSVSSDGIVELPAEVDPRMAHVFDRYMKVVAPNGRPIHVLSTGAGDDLLQGWGGDDLLDGGDGLDVAVFRGAASEYRVEREGEQVVVTDLTADRDGSDRLQCIERLRFADGEVEVPGE